MILKIFKFTIHTFIYTAITTFFVYSTVDFSEEKEDEEFKSLVQDIHASEIDPELIHLINYIQARNSKLPVELAEIEARTIVNVSYSQGVPIDLLVGIVETETSPPFNPLSESSVGATGLMQIYQSPDIVISQDKRFDLQYNLEAGCVIFKGKLKRSKGDMSKALSAYSGGAINYSSRVYESIGRYSMYKHHIITSEVATN